MGLEFDLWREPVSFSLEFPLEVPSIILSLLYTALLLWALGRRLSDFRKLGRLTWVLFIGALVLIVPLYSFLVLSREVKMLPASPVSVLPYTPAISLLGFALVMAVTVWLGPGPGLVANLVAGLATARFYPLTYADLLAFSSWGLVAGLCLHQSYKGELFNVLRHPLPAFLLSAFVPVTLQSLSRMATNLPPGGLLAVDYVLAIWNNELPLWLIAALLLGGLCEVIFLNPRWRPAQRADKVSLYSTSLRVRFMILIIPLVLLGTILSVVAVTARAITLAREQSLEEMNRSAENAAQSITHFHYSGQNMLATFAQDPALLSSDAEQRTQALATARQVVPFFQELILVNEDLKITEAVPEGTPVLGLTSEEAQALARAQSPVHFAQVTRMTLLPSGEYGLTLVEQIFPEDAEEGALPEGYLLGRVQLDVNPEMQRALSALQLTRGAGVGFIMDENGLIIAHPDPVFVMRPWSANLEAFAYAAPVGQGVGYEDVAAEGYRVLIYMLDVSGTPYRVVLQLPFAAVLETAAKISSPLLIVQITVGLILLLAIPFFSTRITRPLNTLAEAANHIARGNLDIPVEISGEDEVAQLGTTFEQMRVRLQARLNDLSLLLNIAQSVSAKLELDRGVAPILEGALEETGAAVARFVLLKGGDRLQRCYTAGDDAPAYDELDRAFAAVLTRRREPLVIRDLAKAKDAAPAAKQLKSVAIFPVRPQNSTVAILWVGAREIDAFDEARTNFLSTLASQAAVLVENARLFQAAEGGRRRLAAILASTTDAILVTDAETRLLLINPAAQRLLELNESAYGQPLSGLPMPEVLIEALTKTLRSAAEEGQPAPAVEVPFQDGRTFYASIAPISGTEGLTLGQVVVMRDITHFKELDEMKSEFVATVSHDLRAPLTFIRGYATMLMMVGDLNDKQHDYLDRILEGIDQMSALIGDLLNLRRIEAGVGIRQEPCRLGLILVEAVDTMRARATGKGVTLRLEPADGAPTIIGDRTLLRQAVSNLVDNAIKYTSPPGQVTVGLGTSEREAIIRIADTGIGIAPEDQVRLFEKFYRIKRRETGNIQGTGLGLALVKSIVERHNGRVWVESEINKGSTFYIALPLSDQDDTQIIPPQEQKPG